MNYKTIFLSFILIFSCVSLLQAEPQIPIPTDSEKEKFTAFGYAYQFVFFSVFEGLYRDGASHADVERILMKQSPEHGYEHFIYSCEICTSTLLAVQAYAKRPQFTMYKMSNGNTFGPGLSKEIQDGLNSDDVKVRLKTIHGLVSKWIKERMDQMHLSDDEKTSLKRAFEDGREQGIKALENFKRNPDLMKAYAPGYSDLKECAICNAASFMDF
jgi:hypothetical protein